MSEACSDWTGSETRPHTLLADDLRQAKEIAAGVPRGTSASVVPIQNVPHGTFLWKLRLDYPATASLLNAMMSAHSCTKIRHCNRASLRPILRTSLDSLKFKWDASL